MRGQNLVQDFLRQKKNKAAVNRGHCERHGISMKPQLTAIAGRPVGIQITSQRDNTIGLASKGVVVLLVKLARGISSHMAFEREQAEEQLAIQLYAHGIGKAPPRRELRAAFMQPVDPVTADKPVGVLIRATTDAGTMKVGGIDSIDVSE